MIKLIKSYFQTKEKYRWKLWDGQNSIKNDGSITTESLKSYLKDIFIQRHTAY